MAKHLARIHGTEEDKVNCPFYFKIGACRHSDRCSRLHHKPAFSPTILIKHLYRHPVRQAELQQATSGGPVPSIDTGKALEDFLCLYEDLYLELSKYGKIDALHVCDNLGDHMIGHVYCKFRNEEQASDAVQAFNGRYYDGRLMQVEFSPVTDFREARCRDFDEDACARGGFCNFLHVKPVPHCLIRSLEEDAMEYRDRQRREERRSSRKGSSGSGGSSSGRRDHKRSSRKRRSRSRSPGDSEEDDRGSSRRHHRRRRTYSESPDRK